jgi:hypothetical protein
MNNEMRGFRDIGLFLVVHRFDVGAARQIDASFF